ncbi:ATP-dependent DNA helicase 2 subunit KU80 [Drosophila grimshawi]|uniref:ATP-dependent DNA helicase II subunit 2 n=1 Tax=Drosophila grimshawi TaxID=7222 RepID=B4JPC4_DROGR|nr:ATP-dependent DNA helicase 2 subunit KU80 [Drosophila grimshawi]EDV98754.1 GH13494 [Drosophila grimshawi]
MASNKECLIIVLDVRSCAAEEFKLKSVKCIAEILKDKIVCDRKDFVSFVLVGCEESENEIHAEDKDACQNVVQYSATQVCNWQLLLNFFKFVNKTPCDEGNWLDGLQVAVALQETAAGLFRFTRRRILLLYDFNFMTQKYDDYKTITDRMLKDEIELIVGTHNIAYIDNAATNQPQAIFQMSRKANLFEQENQKYALQLVSNCNAMLCTFKEALATVFKITNKRPWVWNAKLHIGKVIAIHLQGIIAMKNERHIKLKKVWGEAEELVDREERYFIKGTEVTPLPEDLIDGYMLGGTPVPYDETIVERPAAHSPGLHFVGFVKRSSIPDAYFCGESLYMLVHQKGNETSARKLDALVRALLQRQCVILCWKIFSVKFNTPRIVVLMPQDSTEHRPATLYMLELSYHAQHQFWDFPAIRTAKTECSADQLQAVDKLIDSMDLECLLNDTQLPRQQRQADLLPFDGLPSIFEQNVMDVLERKVVCQTSDDGPLLEMMREKKFVEMYWRVPEPIEEKSKQAAAALKKLFPLEHSHAWLEKLKAKEQESNAPPTIKQERPDSENTTPITIECVGLMTPAEDYRQLLEQVRSMANTTLRDVQFQSLAAQMRVVVITLLERNKLNLNQLSEMLAMHRDSCLEFNSFGEYNQFAAQLKAKASDRNLHEFWTNVIVEKQLGPLVLGEPTLEDELRLMAYYTIPEFPAAAANEDQEMHQDK